MMRELFGRHVRTLRLGRKLTQEALAERGGLSVDTVRRVESGALSPSLETVQKLARGFEVSLTTLFATFEGRQRDYLAELGDLLQTRTPGEVKRALRVMRAMFDQRGQ